MPAGLLERAVGYALGCVQDVAPAHLSRPTPCPGWDLRTLLRHLTDSVDAVGEGIGTGRIGLYPPDDRAAPDPVGAPDPVAALRDRIGQVRRAWAVMPGDRWISVGGQPLPARLMIETVAVELAVHGWDISRSCGRRRPIPPALAAEMLEISRLVVTADTRYPLFGAPVSVPAMVGPGAQLLAFLGRKPE
jgi:uncharacterized protein (TIGR03086 family)